MKLTGEMIARVGLDELLRHPSDFLRLRLGQHVLLLWQLIDTFGLRVEFDIVDGFLGGRGVDLNRRKKSMSKKKACGCERACG